ncbi:MAG TPA: portal protein [Rhizomicrobium sp.]|nr:portal protein [Rhizomicrobium sp.]
MGASDLTSLHATALAQFKFIAETEHDQRARELEALRFQAGDQWTEDAKLARAGLPANASTGSPAVPARPMLTMRTLDQPIAQVVNQEHDADLAITITAKDGKANKDTAEVIAGLIRAIQTDSHADDVYSWGFQRMVGCGRGYWRVNKAYANERAGLDQVIRIEPIENGFSVYLDPLPKWQPNGGFWEPDYGFITAEILEADYLREFGTSKLAKATDSEILEGLGDAQKHWVIETKNADGTAGGKFYRVAEYWYAVYKPVTVDGRTVNQRTIMWAKMNGLEWLDEPQEWDGHFIPIIEDSGNKYNVGGEVIIEGMVQPSISAGRMLNFMVSSAAEKIGLASVSPWLGIAGQFQGYEGFWNQANTRNFPYLEYNAMTPGTGPQLLPPPTRNNDNPEIRSYAEMIGLFTNFIRSTTGVPDAALGHVNPNDRSGKAIEELKAASQQGTSGWLQHHARAIRHTGIVVVDLIPPVYDRSGRKERIISKDGSEDWAILNAPFVKDKDGQPQPAPTGMMQRVKSAIGMGGPEPMAHMLAEGQYGVIVNVGKSRQTLQAETFAGMNALAQAAPELVPRFADLWVRSMGIPKSDEIADRIKPPGVDDEAADLPPEVQAKMAEMQAAMQQLQQLADDNQAKLKIAETNAQVQVIKAQQDGQVKALTQQSADATKIRVAGIQAETQIAVAEIKAGMEEMKTQVMLIADLIGIKHEQQKLMAQNAYDAAKTVHGAEREDEGADAEHRRQIERESMAHEHAYELATTPPPPDPNRDVANG